MLIPKRIRVGFNARKDTYTQKLAYIIYYDEKGVLRKEGSWESWRDKNIPPEEYDNEPTEGFVLNKKVGGYKSDWNFRDAYVRVYDPRGFEFEITVPNLLYILEHTSSIKGKGLDGEFVYAWDEKDLVLLPTSAPEYQQELALSEKIYNAEKIKAKDLKVGNVYLTRDGDELIYLGKFDYYRPGYTVKDKWFPTYRQMVKYVTSIGKLPYRKSWYNSAYRSDISYDEYDYGTYGMDGKYFWFKKRGKGILSGKSVSDLKLVSALGTTADAEELAEGMRMIATLDSFSPPDETKTEYEYLSEAEINSLLARQKSFDLHYIDQTGDVDYISIAYRYASTGVGEDPHYSWRRGWNGPVINPDAQSLITEFHPLKSKTQYLANGNVFRKDEYYK